MQRTIITVSGTLEIAKPSIFIEIRFKFCFMQSLYMYRRRVYNFGHIEWIQIYCSLFA